MNLTARSRSLSEGEIVRTLAETNSPSDLMDYCAFVAWELRRTHDIVWRQRLRRMLRHYQRALHLQSQGRHAQVR